jgi:hypothetical protein
MGVSNRVKAGVGGSKNSLLFVERRKKVERPVTWAPYVLKACCVENSLEYIRIRMYMCWTYTQRRHGIPMRSRCMFKLYLLLKSLCRNTRAKLTTQSYQVASEPTCTILSIPIKFLGVLLSVETTKGRRPDEEALQR